MLSTLWLMPEQEQRIALEIELVLERLRQEISALQRSQHTELPSVAEKVDEVQKPEQEASETLEHETEENPTGASESPGGQGPEVYDGRDCTHQAEDEAEKANLPQDTEETSAEIEPVSPGEDQLGISQETNTHSEEENLTQVEEETNGVGFATATDQAGSPPSTDTSQESDPLEAAKPLQEEPEGQITQDKDDKPQVVSETADAPTSAGSVDSPVRKKFTCGRCSVPIPLGSDFFRCVGHACQGALPFNF